MDFFNNKKNKTKKNLSYKLIEIILKEILSVLKEEANCYRNQKGGNK